MISRRRALQIFAAASLMPSDLRATQKRVAFGAEVSLTLDGPAHVTGPALDAVWAEIEAMEKSFSLYDPTSELSRLNSQGTLERPSAAMLEILALSAKLYRATDGRFDPTVQHLWQAHANGENTASARSSIGFDRVRFDDTRVQLGSGQALTLNGIAQGYATDRVIAVLRARGLERSLVNIGEYRALSGPWRLGIEDPSFGRVGMISLADRAVATSSPAAMRLATGAAHILDPRGVAAVPSWSTVSVIAERAAVADGLSTALCFATLNEVRAIAARFGAPVSIRLVDLTGNLRSL